MDVEIKEGRLIVTPDTLDEERKLFALAAAYKAYEAVMLPIRGEPLRYTEDHQNDNEEIKCGDMLLIKKLTQRLNNIDLYEVQVLGKKTAQ